MNNELQRPVTHDEIEEACEIGGTHFHRVLAIRRLAFERDALRAEARGFFILDERNLTLKEERDTLRAELDRQKHATDVLVDSLDAMTIAIAAAGNAAAQMEAKLRSDKNELLDNEIAQHCACQEREAKLREALKHIRKVSQCRCSVDYTSRGLHGSDCQREIFLTADEALETKGEQ